MRKHSVILILIFSLVILGGCAKSSGQTPNNTENESPKQTNQENLTIKDFFPLTENTKYTYEGKGSEYASFTVYTDYIEGERVQQRSNNGGTETVKVLENKDGQLTMLSSQGDSYFREDLTQKQYSNGEVLLKEPLKKGTTWILPDNQKRYISNEGVLVQTPSGDYQALEVTTENQQGTTLDYYAPGVGLVKTEFRLNEDSVVSTLAKIEKNVPFAQVVQFYYPNMKDNKIYSIKKTLSFHTNDKTKQVMEQEYKNVPQGDLARVLSPQVTINNLYLNKDDGMVYVDFSKELVSEMNAGSGYESMILQSITNTLGVYYGVDKVYITVEGNPYVSGHLQMKKGEAFQVNLKNVIDNQ